LNIRYSLMFERRSAPPRHCFDLTIICGTVSAASSRSLGVNRAASTGRWLSWLDSTSTIPAT